MRAAARALLLVFVFAIPWGYSLNLGAALGSVARLAGLVLLVVAIPAVLQAGRLRSPGALQWLAAALFVWMAATCLWSIDATTSLERLPGYFQELMIVGLVWELAETEGDLRALLRSCLGGCWVLAGLTLANFAFAGSAEVQIRFAAIGQDPNDVARYLDLGLPVAALLADWEPSKGGRLLAFSYLPAGVVAVLLTASRGGFLAALVGLVGCAAVLWRRRKAVVAGALFALPPGLAAVAVLVPRGTLQRIATLADQAQGGDLNQRVNIWESGWHAFTQAPFFGHGAGTFVSAAGLASIDTAHNAALSVLVEGGAAGLVLGAAILAVVTRAALETRGVLRLALATLLAVWCVASLVGTTGESRFTWLLFALLALAGRVTAKEPHTAAARARLVSGPAVQGPA